ncbi:MAG: cytochrome P460 family protein [Myxococcota bacterium]
MSLLLLLALAAGCAPEVAPALFTDARLVEEMDGYAAWESPAAWPGLEATCDGAHGSYVRIYANPKGAAALAAGEALPDGALLVEASFQDAAGTPKLVSAMRKVSGYAPDAGDWYWGQHDEAGALQVGGRIPACASCHAASVGYLRHTDGPPSTDPCVDDTGFPSF